MSIKDRKKDHVDLTVNQDVEYQKKTGFDRYDFVHNALPEVNVSEVDLTAHFLGREFSFPLFISSMTGGYSEAGAVNTVIAEFCENENLPFGVGSQRVMLEEPDEVKSFSVVREYAPNAFIAANIGGAQLIGGLGYDDVQKLIDSIEANAIIVHLNPLQELMQPEGDRDFKGIEKGIADLVEKSEQPVIVKETGAGISSEVAKRLLNLGVAVIDIAGAGGTSWAKVENLRETQTQPLHAFNNWGLPTIESLLQVQTLKKEYNFELIASGGIRNSFDIVKAMGLGADFTAAAQPIIKAIINGGYDQLDEIFQNWKKECRYILALLGCCSIKEVSPDHLYKTF